MKAKDTLFYKTFRPLVSLWFKCFYRPTIVGVENIPKNGGFVLAGNHTKQLDPFILASACKRQLHFLAKEELFSSKVAFIIKAVGCIPVNRKIHDKGALNSAIDFLNKGLCVTIFPEGTINRTNDVIMPFKIGAIKAAHDSDTVLVPFVITGKYKMFRKSVKIEFLNPMKISDDLSSENEKFMNIIKNKIIEEGVRK